MCYGLPEGVVRVKGILAFEEDRLTRSVNHACRYPSHLYTIASLVLGNLAATFPGENAPIMPAKILFNQVEKEGGIDIQEREYLLEAVGVTPPNLNYTGVFST